MSKKHVKDEVDSDACGTALKHPPFWPGILLLILLGLGALLVVIVGYSLYSEANEAEEALAEASFPVEVSPEIMKEMSYESRGQKIEVVSLDPNGGIYGGNGTLPARTTISDPDGNKLVFTPAITDVALANFTDEGWYDDEMTIEFSTSIHAQSHIVMEIPGNAGILKIRSGDGWIILNMENGAVTFENCEPDESSKEFWKAVEVAWKLMKPKLCYHNVQCAKCLKGE